jgi:electron transfer flavoprotein alpha/beta subunit
MLPESCQGELTALTIDGDQADLFLRNLYAVQYHQGVRIDCGCEIDLRFNPWAVSLLIASYVRRIGGQHLIMLGCQGGLGDNRQTGFLVAERLGWPCIRDVVDVTPDQGPGWLKVTSRGDGAVVSQTVALPLVLVVGNALHSPYLRVPTLNEKLATKNKQVTVFSPGDLGLAADDLEERDSRLLKIFRQGRGRNCRIIEGETAEDKAQELFNGYLAGKLHR